MDALLLSAGFGTRIKKLTKKRPKCLLEINGKAIIDIWIDLIKLGIKRIYINTHYLADQVKTHFKKHKHRKIVVICHEKILGTAGTLIKLIKKTIAFLMISF